MEEILICRSGFTGLSHDSQEVNLLQNEVQVALCTDGAIGIGLAGFDVSMAFVEIGMHAFGTLETSFIVGIHPYARLGGDQNTK